MIEYQSVNVKLLNLQLDRLSGNVMIFHLIVRKIKKIFLYKISYFPEPYIHSKSKIKVELDLSNYTTKSDLKSATGVDASKIAKKVDLADLKL